MRHAAALLLIASAATLDAAVAAAPAEPAPAAEPRRARDTHSVRLAIDAETVSRDRYDSAHGGGHVAVSERFGAADIGLMLRGRFAWSDRAGDLPTGSLAYLAVPKWRFAPDATWSPYLGAQLGAQTTWYDDQSGVVASSGTAAGRRSIATTFAVGGLAGVDVFASHDTSIYLELSSLYTVIQGDVVREYGLAAGLSYWF